MLVIEECDFLEYLEIKTDRGYYVSPGLMSLCHKSNLKQIFVNTKLNWHKMPKTMILKLFLMCQTGGSILLLRKITIKVMKKVFG